MPIKEPRWWYDTGNGAGAAGRRGMALALGPAAHLYGRIAVRRFSRATPYRSRLPVICIGNLVAGGTGKTPLALHIALMLQASGAKPAFLSRGHGGCLLGPHRVDPISDTAADVGDEPLLLAQAAPTVIARDRVAGARLIEATEATHIVMDDGLQNPFLRKDLSIAVIDGERWIGNGLTIPAGPLRAPLGFQAGLVDAVVISAAAVSGPRPVLPGALRGLFKVPVLVAERRADGDVDWLRQRSWIAYAGIGNPGGFFAMLEKHGARLAARVPFADHHPFSAIDARRLLTLAGTHGAGLVTTAKDLVRIAADGAELTRLKSQSRTLPLSLALSQSDTALLSSLLANLAPPARV
jgi:tetraacyldisaccharide 4'-kinase